MPSYYQNNFLEKKLRPFDCLDRMYEYGYARPFNNHSAFRSDIFAAEGSFGTGTSLKVPFLIDFLDFNPLQAYLFNECQTATPEYLGQFSYPPSVPSPDLVGKFLDLTSLFDFDMAAVRDASAGLSLEQLHIILAAKEFSNAYHSDYSNITQHMINHFYPTFEYHSPEHGTEIFLMTGQEEKMRFFNILETADKAISILADAKEPYPCRLDAVHLLEKADELCHLDFASLCKTGNERKLLHDFIGIANFLDFSTGSFSNGFVPSSVIRNKKNKSVHLRNEDQRTR